MCGSQTEQAKYRIKIQKRKQTTQEGINVCIYSVDGTGLMSLTASLWSKMTNTNKKYVHK